MNKKVNSSLKKKYLEGLWQDTSALCCALLLRGGSHGVNGEVEGLFSSQRLH